MSYARDCYSTLDILGCTFGLRHKSLWYHSRIVQIQWIFSDFLQNSQLNRALSPWLLGVRSQPRYLNLSTPLAWSTEQVKSRVVPLYAYFFRWLSESIFKKSTFGDADHPILLLILLILVIIDEPISTSGKKYKFQTKISRWLFVGFLKILYIWIGNYPFSSVGHLN